MTKSAHSVNWGFICHVFRRLKALTRIQQGGSQLKQQVPESVIIPIRMQSINWS